MSEEGYNGWTNYATWGAALIFDNDPATARRCRELTTRARAGMYPELHLSEDLRDYAGELAYDREQPEMASQMIAAGFAEVNWREIAEDYVADAE